MNTTDPIRGDTIRHALADARAVCAVAKGSEGYETGRHLPSPLRLADGTWLRFCVADASDGGLLLGVFVAIRTRYHDGESIRTYNL